MRLHRRQAPLGLSVCYAGNTVPLQPIGTEGGSRLGCTFQHSDDGPAEKRRRSFA